MDNINVLKIIIVQEMKLILLLGIKINIQENVLMKILILIFINFSVECVEKYLSVSSDNNNNKCIVDKTRKNICSIFSVKIDISDESLTEEMIDILVEYYSDSFQDFLSHINQYIGSNYVILIYKIISCLIELLTNITIITFPCKNKIKKFYNIDENGPLIKVLIEFPRIKFSPLSIFFLFNPYNDQKL